MPSDEIEVDVSHKATYCCTDCGTDIRVGQIENQYGLFCGCTVAEGRPFKDLDWGMHPWPERWELEEKNE